MFASQCSHQLIRTRALDCGIKIGPLLSVFAYLAVSSIYFPIIMFAFWFDSFFYNLFQARGII